jgi:hypothetical protein
MRLATILLVAMAAGCIGGSFHATDRAFPGTMPAGLLDEYGLYTLHSGFYEAYLQPNGTQGAPASCAVFRDRVAYQEDRCAVVLDARDHDRALAWAINATWTAGGPGGPKAVVDYDAAGAPVAWWDGVRRTGGAWHVTE